jgi:hypothetical protein
MRQQNWKQFKKISGLYYKHTMIINYASSVINKLKALLTDDARVVIYDCHVFIVQPTAFLGSLGSAILSKKFVIN